MCGFIPHAHPEYSRLTLNRKKLRKIVSQIKLAKSAAEIEQQNIQEIAGSVEDSSGMVHACGKNFLLMFLASKFDFLG